MNGHTDLHNRTAIVTGASAGIGEATALHLASLGAAVVVNARRRERLDALVTRIEAEGGRAVAVAGDCASPEVIEAMLAASGALRADGGREPHSHDAGSAPDLVVINAGRGLAGSVMTSDESQWEDMIRTNVLACARLLRAASLRMLSHASEGEQTPNGRNSSPTTEADSGSPSATRGATPRDIIILGSNVGKHISPFSSMYGSTKFAVGAIAEGARRELGPKGIRVTLICPGIVKTEFQQVAGYDADWAREFFARFNPVLEGIDVARTIAFVAAQPTHVHLNDIIMRPTRQDYP